MTAAPYMPMFWGDYFADTQHLDCEENGAYLLLLGTMWMAGGSLPADEKRLARCCRLSLKKFKRIWPVLKPFFSEKDGLLSQGRLTKERNYVQSRTELRRSAGALGGRPKSLKDNKPPKAKGFEKEKQNESKTKAPIPTPIKKEKIYKKENPDFEEIKKWWNEKGLTVSIDLEWEKYQLWLQTNGKRHKNKTAGFKNWLLKAQEFSRDGPDAPRSTEQAARDREQAAAAKDSFVRSEIKSAEKLAARYNEPLESYLPGIAKQAGVELAFVEARVDATPAIPEQFRRTA